MNVYSEPRNLLWRAIMKNINLFEEVNIKYFIKFTIPIGGISKFLRGPYYYY